MPKVSIFVSTLNCFGLLEFLKSKNMLSLVVVANKNNMDTHTLVQTLHQYKIPYFVYSGEDKELLKVLKDIGSNLGIVFGFPYKISKDIIEHFSNDIFNIHASALPKYRGSDPIFWQLRNAEEETSIVIHKLTENFDEGDILLRENFQINYQDTYGTLQGMILQYVLSLIEDFFKLYIGGELKSISQIGKATFAKRVDESDLFINWENMKSSEIYNLVRASNPVFGGAKTMWKGSVISFFEITIVDMDNLGLKAGTVLHIGSPNGLIVSTIDGALRLDIVSVPDGLFSGIRFAKRFNLDAGESLSSIDF